MVCDLNLQKFMESKKINGYAFSLNISGSFVAFDSTHKPKGDWGQGDSFIS